MLLQNIRNKYIHETGNAADQEYQCTQEFDLVVKVQRNTYRTLQYHYINIHLSLYYCIRKLRLTVKVL